MTTSRMNSHGKNVYVLARRKEHRGNSWVDRRNEAAVVKAVRLGFSFAHILHPTKGYRRVSLDKPRPFAGVRDRWARAIGKHIREVGHG